METDVMKKVIAIKRDREQKALQREREENQKIKLEKLMQYFKKYFLDNQAYIKIPKNISQKA